MSIAIDRPVERSQEASSQNLRSVDQGEGSSRGAVFADALTQQLNDPDPLSAGVKPATTQANNHAKSAALETQASEHSAIDTLKEADPKKLSLAQLKGSQTSEGSSKLSASKDLASVPPRSVGARAGLQKENIQRLIFAGGIAQTPSVAARDAAACAVDLAAPKRIVLSVASHLSNPTGETAKPEDGSPQNLALSQNMERVSFATTPSSQPAGDPLSASIAGKKLEGTPGPEEKVGISGVPSPVIASKRTGPDGLPLATAVDPREAKTGTSISQPSQGIESSFSAAVHSAVDSSTGSGSATLATGFESQFRTSLHTQPMQKKQANAPTNVATLVGGRETVPFVPLVQSQPTDSRSQYPMAQISSSQSQAGKALAQDPFTVMDGSLNEHPAQVLRASHREMEIGILDSTYGWVEIKTHLSGGQLNASLLTTSHDAHHVLQTQLPALAEYLSNHDIHVNNLSLSGHTANAEDGSKNGGQESGAGKQGAASKEIGTDEAISQRPAISSEDALLRYDPGRNLLINVMA